MGDLPYRELGPALRLAPWVECVWHRRREWPAGESGVHRILPDGCVDLVFDLGRLRAGEEQGALAVGTMRRALVRRPRGPEEHLGVRFRPGRASVLFGFPLDEITDRREPMAALWPRRELRELSGRLVEAESLRTRKALVEEFVGERLDENGAPPDWILEAVDRVARRSGEIRIEALSREIGVTRQALARRFREAVGISPKELCRVMRLHGVLKVARANPGWSWSRAAAEAGYYDQSHLIREVKRLARARPPELVRPQ